MAAKDALLPDGWAVWPLKRLLSSFELGGNYPNSLTATDYPLMKMGNLGRGRFDLAKIEYVASGTTPIERHRLRRSDVLFNTRNTLDLVGKIAMWREEVECAYFNSNLMRLNFDPEIIVSNEFANLALNSEGSISGLRAMATGTTSVAAIYTRDLLTLPVVVPPAKEQEAIAAALSDADGVVAGLERVIAKKRLIKQGAMQDLLTARRRLPGFSGEWKETRLGQYGKTYGGLAGKSKQDFGVGTDSYIEFLDVINSTAISGGEFPKVRLSAGERQNRVQRNDLLFNGSSETPEEVGLCAAVIADLENTYLNSFCFGYRLFSSDQIDPIFMAALIRSGEGRERIKHLAQGATRYNLSKRALLELAIKLPSYNEQKAIAAVLSDMDAEIQTLESRLAKARAVKEGMMQNLLTGRVRLV